MEDIIVSLVTGNLSVMHVLVTLMSVDEERTSDVSAADSTSRFKPFDRCWVLPFAER